MACGSEMIRDTEVISGNIPNACLTRPGDYEVQHMTKMVCGHSDVLSKDDAGRANREVPRISMNEVRAGMRQGQH